MSSSVRKTIQKVMAIVLIAVMGLSVVYAEATNVSVTLPASSKGENSKSIWGKQTFIGTETKNGAGSTQNMYAIFQYKQFTISFFDKDKSIEIAPGKNAAGHTGSTALTQNWLWRLRLEPKNPSAKGVTGAGRLYNF